MDSKWPHEYPKIACFGFIIVRSIMTKLPSEYLSHKYLKFSVVPISVTGGPTFAKESWSISTAVFRAAGPGLSEAAADTLHPPGGGVGRRADA